MPGGQRHLEPQHELVERCGGQQPALAVGRDRGARGCRQRTVRPTQPFAEAVEAKDAVRVPEETDGRREHAPQQRRSAAVYAARCRCSTSDMVPSGLTRDRRRRGSSFLRNPGVCTGLPRGRGLETRLCRAQWVRPRIRPGACPTAARQAEPPGRRHPVPVPPGCRRVPRQSVWPAGCCVRLGVGLHLLDLGLEDPHRLAERTRRVRELLGTEEQHEYRDDDYPVPGL